MVELRGLRTWGLCSLSLPGSRVEREAAAFSGAHSHEAGMVSVKCFLLFFFPRF